MDAHYDTRLAIIFLVAFQQLPYFHCLSWTAQRYAVVTAEAILQLVCIKAGHADEMLDLGCSEKLASDTPKPFSRRAVISRAVAPPCSMSVTLPAAEMFCSS